MAIERNVMAGHIVGAILLRHKVVEEALAACVRASRIAVIRAGKRVL